MRNCSLPTTFLGLLIPALLAAQAPLPVRKVVLYRNGMGYFEHLGEVRESQTVEIALPASQLNDVLKSLTVLDLGEGKVTGVTYDSAEPVGRRLAELPVKLDSSQGVVDFLNQIRGTQVEIRAAGAPVAGRLMGAEVRRKQVGEYTVKETIEVAVFTAQGELRSVELSPASALRLVEKELAADVSRYLEVLDSAHQRDVRRLKISTAGSGARQLFVSYTSEAPIWKTTYRIVLDEKKRPFLQGWAIVDNTTPTDWPNVGLSPVAGAPVSFVQNLSQPLYARRPVIPLPEGVQVTPQTHEATLELPSGKSGISGAVKDQTGGGIPGANVTISDEQRRTVATANTDNAGRFRVELEPGTYRLRASATGFQAAEYSTTVNPGRVSASDLTLRVAAAMETVTVQDKTPELETSTAIVRTRRGARVESALSPPPTIPSVSEAMRQQASETAQAQAVAEQFEYKLRQPVTILKNQSALLPIVQTEVEGQKVTLYNETGGDRRSRLALWLKNTSGLTLDGGSFTVMDSNVFAGEGLTETVHPQESRLLSYGLDLGVEVNTSRDSEQQRVERIEVARGVMRLQSKLAEKKTYVIRNNDDKPRSVVLEHPVRSGWTLVETAKPAESSARYHRFRVEAQPKTTTQFVVREENVQLTAYDLRSVTPAQIEIWVRLRMVDAEIEKALQGIVAKKAEIDDLNKKTEKLEEEREEIDNDQKRVRENLAKLGASKEEVALRQRYVRQLQQQEDRVEQIRAEHARFEERRAAAQKELESLLSNLSMERKL